MYYFLISLIIIGIYADIFNQHHKLKLKTDKIILYSKSISNLLSLIIIVFLWFLLVFKSFDVGGDTKTYLYMYSESKYYVQNGLVWDFLHQPLYYLTFYILEKIFSFRTALLIIYTLCIGVFYRFICKNSKNGTLVIFLFVVNEGLAFYMSGLRQMIAITIGLIAFSFAIKKKKVFFVIFSLLAVLFHKSALILFAAIPFWFLFAKKRHDWLVLIVWIICLFFPIDLLVKLADVLSFGNYIEVIGTSSNPLLILVHICMGLFVLFVRSYIDVKEESENYLFPLFVLSISIMLASSKFYLLTRFCYYFNLPLYIVMADNVNKVLGEKTFKRKCNETRADRRQSGSFFPHLRQ